MYVKFREETNMFILSGTRSLNWIFIKFQDCLPTKFEASGVKHSRVNSCTSCWRRTWPLTYWPEYKKESSTYQGQSTYQVWSFRGKAFLSYQLHKVWETNMTFVLDIWPTDLNINSDHLLVKYYLPTKFVTYGTKSSWVISCTRCRRLTWPLILVFELLTWLSRTIYLPSLKLLGGKRSWVISCTRYRLTWPLTYWPDYK